MDKIVVVGSMNMDIVFETERSPEVGETLIGKNFMTTLGANGAKLINSSSEKSFTGIKVNAVDTTAAGDTFAGAFACGLQNGMSESEAIDFAMAAAALSVTKPGAQISMPELNEVENFIG